MKALLGFAEGTRRLLERVALVSGWLLVVMALVTCFDVLARKTGLPVPLTKLQELEWHFHAVIFSMWMGYGYVINAHPRVDSFTEKLTFRRKAWLELLVNNKKWNELSEEHKRMIEVACDANITWTFVNSEARQFGAMRELVDKHGVKIHFWSDAILAKMRSAWEEVITEESAKDPDFKRAHDSLAAFRKQYAIWKEHGYLK